MRAEQIEFIRLNVQQIAAHAWQGYENKGRGMICVLVEERNELLRTVPYDFLPASEAHNLLRPWRGSKERRMVADYDPAAEMIICFVRKGHGERIDIDSYRICPAMSPRQAGDSE